MAKPNEKFKAPERTLQDQVDEVIDWYERYKPDAGKRIEVNCFVADVAKFSSTKHAAPVFYDGKIEYRGREIVPVKKKQPSKKKFMAASQAQIDAARMS